MKWEEQYQKYGEYIIYIFICVALLVCGFAEYQRRQGEKEREELKKAKLHPYFTEQHLTWKEMQILKLYFRVETTPDYEEEKEKREGPDFSYIEIKPTKSTEKAIAVINHYLFDEFLEEDAEGKEYVEKMGFSYKNRLTTDWAITHLHELVVVFHKCPLVEYALSLDSLSLNYDLIKEKLICTKFLLSYSEITSLNSWFGIETIPELPKLRVKFRDEGQTDFTDMTMQASEYTYKVAAVMNYILFEEASEKDAKAIQIAEECGLSKENPLTAEWILTHPREAIEIKNGMENYGEIIYNQDKILEKYEEIE